MASVDEEPTQWPATRGPSLDEESGSLTPVSSAFSLEKECSCKVQFPATWGESMASMQRFAMHGACLAEDAFPWDPTQWELNSTSATGVNPTAAVGEDLLGLGSGDADFVVEPVSRLNPWPVDWEGFMQPVAVPDTQPHDFFCIEDTLSRLFPF